MVIYPSLKSLPEFDFYLVDAYGPFVGKEGVSQTAIAVLAALVAAGKKVCILSNSASLAAEAMAGYARKGLLRNVHYTDFLTSGQIAREIILVGALPVQGHKFYCFGTANFKSSDKMPALFKESVYMAVDDLARADFVYCGIPQINGEDRMEIEAFIPELQQIAAAGLPMICANPDLRANEGGQFVIRQGSIAGAFAQMGGRVILYGKPDIRVFERALQGYSGPHDQILMIGDTLGTDILGANRAGIRSCLTLEGGISEYEMQCQGLKADEAGTAAFISAQKARPDYVCRRLPEAPMFPRAVNFQAE